METLDELFRHVPISGFVKSKDDFNHALDHILELLVSSEVLYEGGIWGGSLFFSITALEEISKLHFGMHIEWDKKLEKNRPIWTRDHRSKHKLSISPVLHLCERLKLVLTEDQLQTIKKGAFNGDWSKLREAAIYFDKRDGELVTPKDMIQSNDASNFLLFALEMFDDQLVGYTDYSIELSRRINNTFNKLAVR